MRAALSTPIDAGSLEEGRGAALTEAVERLHESVDLAQLWPSLAAEAAALIPAERVAVVVRRKRAWRVLAESSGSGRLTATSAATVLAGEVGEGQLLATGCFPEPTSGAAGRALLVVALAWTSRDPLRLVWLGRGTRTPEAHTAVAHAFARHASLAVRAVSLRESLQQAVEARHRVGLAQGILMSRYHVTTEHAFAILPRPSVNSNVKLHVIAQSVVGSGALPKIPPVAS